MSAFFYLVMASGRNRLRAGLRRARSPRYSAAILIGVIYVWSFLFRPTARIGTSSLLLGQPTEMLVTLIAVLMLMNSWLFGSDATALAFTQAEVSMLFPAPLSRRSLIIYKLFRAQITVLLNALVWVFILRRGGTLLPSPMRAVGLWVLFSVLNLHRLGAALVRSSWREHGTAGARRHWASIVVFATIGVLLLAGLIGARHALLGAVGMRAFFAALGRVLAGAPAYWGLYPFHLVVAPTFARSSGEWARLMVPALAVLAVHGWWVLRTDTAFEDAALDASAQRAARTAAARARRSAGGAGPSRAATSTLRLAPVGSPAAAIFWKNMLCLRRTSQLRVFVGPTVMAIALGAATSGGGADGPQVIAIGAMMLAGMLFMFGGRLIRNDLRHDMQHLPLIKTLPLAADDIVLAEVASSALPMAGIQMVLVAAAYIAATASLNDPLGADMRLAMLVAAPFVLVALNGALLTIQNGTVVLFPDWVKLGPVVSTGVEALGQNVLAMIANLISLAIALVLPLVVALGTLALIGRPQPFTIALAAIVGSIILLAETRAAIHMLGGALTRAEPSQTE